MSRPAFYDVRLRGGPITLCAPCTAVLVMDGRLAGDPREEAVQAGDVVRFTPRAELPSDSRPPSCDVCWGVQRYQSHQPVLRMPPERMGQLLPVGDMRQTVYTFREMEGDDSPPSEAEHFGIRSY
jgi:hypothetical protein